MVDPLPAIGDPSNLLTHSYCEEREGATLYNSERRSEPRYVYDILAEIVADLKPRKEEDSRNDETRNSYEECEQTTD